jgi:hypothetical protein
MTLPLPYNFKKIKKSRRKRLWGDIVQAEVTAFSIK